MKCTTSGLCIWTSSSRHRLVITLDHLRKRFEYDVHILLSSHLHRSAIRQKFSCIFACYFFVCDPIFALVIPVFVHQDQMLCPETLQLRHWVRALQSSALAPHVDSAQLCGPQQSTWYDNIKYYVRRKFLMNVFNEINWSTGLINIDEWASARSLLCAIIHFTIIQRLLNIVQNLGARRKPIHWTYSLKRIQCIET